MHVCVLCVEYIYSYFTSVSSIPIKAMASNGGAKIANSAPSQHRLDYIAYQ